MIWKQPCGGYYFGYGDMEEVLYDDENIAQYSEKNDFYVKKYDIDIDLSKEMSFKVVMTLSDDLCSEYDFTLCNLYSIQSVRDEKGESLEYVRNRNSLTIKNGDLNLKKIIIEYTGISLNRYAVGENGIYLPGNFPFYPIAGKKPVLYHGLCELPADESRFQVKVNYKKKILSNLNQVADNEFDGISNNFTMVSGFWEEKKIDGFRMIYPYVSVNYNPEKNAYLLNGIREYSTYKSEKPINGQTYQMSGKTIIIAPFGYEGGNYMFASDTVLVGCKWDLDNIYKKYLMTGEWYQFNEVTDDDIQQVLEDNSK